MHDHAVDEDRVAERNLLGVADEVWALAVRRALGISRRQVYVLLGRWRAGRAWPQT